MNRNTEPKTLDFSHVKRHSNKDLNDPICIAMIAWQPNDLLPPPGDKDTRSGILAGDVFWACGYTWYYSGHQHEGRDLRCGWLQHNVVHGYANSIFINTDVMSRRHIPNYRNKNICGLGVAFSGSRQRALSNTNNGTVIASHGPRGWVSNNLSAIDLCDSPTSHGPSFYNTKERVFCDMDSKTKINRCTKDQTGECFEYGAGTRSEERRIVVRNVARKNVHREFTLNYYTIDNFNGEIVDDGGVF